MQKAQHCCIKERLICPLEGPVLESSTGPLAKGLIFQCSFNEILPHHLVQSLDQVMAGQLAMVLSCCGTNIHGYRA